MTHAAQGSDLIVPTQNETKMAEDASRILATLSTRTELHLELQGDHERMNMVLPPNIVRVIQRVLTELAQGNAVTVMPISAELTTQEAADFLNVSRPFIVKQIEEKKIPHRKVGTHRRIRVQDLLDYKKAIDAARHQNLDDLTSEAQRLGLGY
jgi:excisionase family DNA binding protein